MAFTQEEIDKIKAAGLEAPTVPGTQPTKSFAERHGGVAAAPIAPVAPAPETMGSKIVGRFNTAVSDVKKAGSNIVDNSMNPNYSFGEKVARNVSEVGALPMHLAGDAGGAVGDVIAPVVEGAMKYNNVTAGTKIGQAIGDAIVPQAMKDKLQPTVDNINNSISNTSSDAMTKAKAWWDTFSKNNPEAARGGEDIGNMLNLIGLDQIVKPIFKSAVSKINPIPKIKEIGLNKTPEEILATPESQAHKLNTTERDFYKNSQKEKITKQFEEEGNLTKNEFKVKQDALDMSHNVLETKVKTQLANDVLKSEKEIANLSKEVDQTAYNKTVELKPKAINALREQSKTYRNLIDEDIAPHKDTYIDDKDVIKAIQDKFPSNPYSPDPYKADRLIKEMNLKEGSVRKVGEMYDNLKDIKSMISAGGKRGTKVFSPSDMDLTDKISALSDALSANGVDLSRANQFWKQWAPLRDKIVTKLKPFDVGNFETKTFSEILKSSGDDIHNQNFIKEFEKVLGEPITKETQTAISKLSAAEKAKVATEVDAKMVIEEARLAKKYKLDSLSSQEQAAKGTTKSGKDAAEEALKLRQYNIDRLAARRSAVKTALKAVAVATTGYGIGVPIYNAVTGN